MEAWRMGGIARRPEATTLALIDNGLLMEALQGPLGVMSDMRQESGPRETQCQPSHLLAPFGGDHQNSSRTALHTILPTQSPP